MSSTRVAVAMSGGVDSSVACLILKRAGFDVIGFTMRLFDTSAESSKAVQDAKKVCESLAVPHHVLDMVELFEHEVVKPFLDEYSLGRTPNPCVVCNRCMKFGHLLDKVRELDVDFLATGHYVRTAIKDKAVNDGSDWLDLYSVIAEGRVDHSQKVHLLRGKDRRKDQSYALYGLKSEILKRLLFPLGPLTKTEVRQIAKEEGLFTAEKSESQEICFVPNNDYRKFLVSRGLVSKVGQVLDTSGKVLGLHPGVSNFTVGQRRGLGALGIHGAQPYYVVEVNPSSNTVVVGTREEVYSRSCLVENLNLLVSSADEVNEEVRGTCMVRYRGKEVGATLRILSGHEAEVLFDSPQFAVTPGQSLVFYQGEIVYGGGVLRSSFR